MTETANKTGQVEWSEIPNPAKAPPPSSARVVHGRLIPAQQQIFLYSSDDWEEFVQEWVQYQRTKYVKVIRFSGPGDMGIDVAAFTDNAGLEGVWDNYQCKGYGDALTPKTAFPEIAKILWHSFSGQYVPPRKYYFMAPKDCGIGLSKLLAKPAELKKQVIKRWDAWCADAITSKQTVKLAGAFNDYVSSFDFTIFTTKTALEAIDEHRQTPYYSTRFGGGLGDRLTIDSPPTDPTPAESRYLQQLFEAYSDNQKANILDLNGLASLPDLIDHYHRQRETFYHAESLRNFARDSVPAGTFEDLQGEVHAGVIDVSTSAHPDALARLNSVTQTAANLPLMANGLISVTKIQDKKGICHQLANVDRLKWLKK